MLDIFVDADACPVKQEVYRVAGRHGLQVTLASNKSMRTPDGNRVKLVVVSDGLDAADDWIVEQAGEDDIVITADILMVARCIEKKALVLGPTGRPFTEENIGDILATRNLMAELREAGIEGGGPAPFKPKDRSRFLHALDEMILSVRRKRGTGTRK